MKFVSKELALKLKEKGFNKPCFGYYYIETPTGFVDEELVLNRYPCRGGTYEDTLERHIDFQPKEGFVVYINPNVVDAPTIEQVLEWLREEKGVLLAIGYNKRKKYRYVVISITYNGEEPDIFEFGFNTYEDACIAGINFVVEHLI